MFDSKTVHRLFTKNFFSCTLHQSIQLYSAYIALFLCKSEIQSAYQGKQHNRNDIWEVDFKQEKHTLLKGEF